jgi:phosphohistidine phosphatase
MRQLLLLRHAKAARDLRDVADRDRPLEPRGRRDIALIREAMQKLGLLPDLVLVSPSKRTMQTLSGLEPWDETPLIEPMEQLYPGESAAILAALQEVAETVRSVLVIGHNPGLHNVAVQLAGKADSELNRRLRAKFPTAALAEFVVRGLWRDLETATLARLLVPSELR